MEKYGEILERCPLFAGVDPVDIQGMLGCLGARKERREKGSSFLSVGEPVDFMGVVLSGAVDITRQEYDGSRRLLAHLTPGELFAEAFACAGVTSCPVDVTAGADTEILRLDVFRVTHSCSNACAFHSRLVYNLLRIVAEKNLQFHSRLEIISQRTTRKRLLTYLEMAAREQGRGKITIPFDRQDLADYLGVDRSGLSAEIGRLRKEGILESRKREFILHGHKDIT